MLISIIVQYNLVLKPDKNIVRNKNLRLISFLNREEISQIKILANLIQWLFFFCSTNALKNKHYRRHFKKLHVNLSCEHSSKNCKEHSYVCVQEKWVHMYRGMYRNLYSFIHHSQILEMVKMSNNRKSDKIFYIRYEILHSNK